MVQSGSLHIFPNYNLGEFPQQVSLSFSAKIPATPGYIYIRYAGYVDTLSGCRMEFSKSRLPNLYKGASNIVTFLECRVFRGTLPRNSATFRGFSAQVL